MASNSNQASPRIVILGAGTGGTIMANRLAKALPDGQITVVDRDGDHIYQPGLLFVPFGLQDPDKLVRPRARQIRESVMYVESTVDRVNVEMDEVHLETGDVLPYDVLIVASGTRLLPEETEGMLGERWQDSVFDFYTLEGVKKLHDALENFTGGRLVTNVVDMPIKCPVAPLEFTFLADWYFTERGIRDQVQLAYVTPLDAAFTKPVAAEKLGHLLGEKKIELVANFATGEVDNEKGMLRSWDGREVAFDLAVMIPVHGGAEYVERSPGLGDELGFVPTDLNTLQSKVKPNIFALGDATNLPTSKAGSVTHFEASVLTDNILRFLRGEELQGDYDGHANCFVETGFHKALLIDFNYDEQPMPGRFPSPHLGPLSLLQESRLNHWSKLMFEWFYWHALLPGRELPPMLQTS